ncbi:MAG: hypothetical protein RMJ75_04625 [Nitrososphaerota archaeon]|nr:hypothetical protein [Nitrososphaerota archaeon]
MLIAGIPELVAFFIVLGGLVFMKGIRSIESEEDPNKARLLVPSLNSAAVGFTTTGDPLLQRFTLSHGYTPIFVTVDSSFMLKMRERISIKHQIASVSVIVGVGV